MKLLALSLTHFKGIKSLEIKADGKNLNIYGDNAVGKTTLYDAFQWLLFNKDSQNKTDFGIKTLDADGNELHYLNHEVSGQFDVNGTVFELRKVFAEKWTKKRGSALEEFTGHSTEYYIDGVPKSKKEYDSFINAIISEDKFKLLTNPDYFNNQLHWQERRKILLQVCGDMSDAEVIAFDRKLDKLTDILKGHSIEDHKKIIAARRSKINKELEEIPARIDEANRALPDVSGLDIHALTTEIKQLKEDKCKKEQEMTRIHSGSEIASQQKLVAEINLKIVDLQTKFRSENADQSFAQKQELQELRMKMSGIESNIRLNQEALDGNNALLKDYEVKRKELLKKWHEVNQREFSIAVADTCPTCNQSLPPAQIEETTAKALAEFNLNKANELAAIELKGKKVKTSINTVNDKIAELNTKKSKLIEGKDDVQLAIAVLEADINSVHGKVSIEDGFEYRQTLGDKQAIENKIIALKNEAQTVIDGLTREIQSIEASVKISETNLLKLDQAEQGRKRIAELSDQEKLLAAEFEKLDQQQFLIESFIKTKVGLLEDRINSKFKYARFKMFNTQVNGGLDECCETLINGVPFGAGLNNAAKINAGLDIINTLAKFYNFQPVIFIDNAESVTELIDTDAQVIRLVVSKADKKLRIESEAI